MFDRRNPLDEYRHRQSTFGKKFILQRAFIIDISNCLEDAGIKSKVWVDADHIDLIDFQKHLVFEEPCVVAVKPKIIGWRTTNHVMETSKKDVALNWAGYLDIEPIFEGDPYTEIKGATDE